MSNPLPPRYGAPITLAEAKRVMAAAEAECAKQGDWPMVIAIVDGSANLVMLQALDTVNVAQMTRYREEGHFPAGSMLPKIVASLEFLHHGGRRVIITSPDCLPAALRGETGTHIVNEGR